MRLKIFGFFLATIAFLTITQLTLLASEIVPITAPKKYPEGELGRIIKLGEAIMNETDTHPLTKEYVGNKLQCKSCHLRGTDGKPGTTSAISTWIGTATAFPAYSKREQLLQTLQDRSDNCFMRSMNGTRPPIDAEASIAMASYITWLSTGMPIKQNVKIPCSPLNEKRWVDGQQLFGELQKKATHENYLHGKKLYVEKCSSCHTKTGKGMGSFPPLWGKDKEGKWLSYNAGAGLGKLDKVATWIQSNMPLGQGNTLKDQEAADIALYVDAQPRAEFNLKERLLPHDKRGYYNSKILEEMHSVRSNFKAFGLDIDKIRGDKKIK